MKEIVHLKSIREAHDFLSLPVPEHPLISVVELNDRIINYDYGETKFLFDFYQVSLKSGFAGSMLYGRNSYDFEDGSLTFIKAGQVIQMERLHDPVQGGSGWTLLFHPDLIRKSDLGISIDDFSFFHYDIHEALHLSEKEIQSLDDLVKKIREEYQQNIDKHSQELMIGNIEMLLKYSKRFYDRQFYTRSNLNQDILASFQRILKAYYSSDKPAAFGILSVKECADELNLSVNYFGDLMKAETGRSAKDHIQDFIIEKAKNRLLSSNQSVSEIAYDLGYAYPQSLNKIFKARVGVSPNQYRSQN
ncbi:AraC family transcriptional regulator [Cryomorphaceae bacterium]|nr:AraC family transcriptional regulator [Cryomorphaceae bacterium]